MKWFMLILVPSLIPALSFAKPNYSQLPKSSRLYCESVGAFAEQVKEAANWSGLIQHQAESKEISLDDPKFARPLLDLLLARDRALSLKQRFEYDTTQSYFNDDSAQTSAEVIIEITGEMKAAIKKLEVAYEAKFGKDYPMLGFDESDIGQYPLGKICFPRR